MLIMASMLTPSFNRQMTIDLSQNNKRIMKNSLLLTVPLSASGEDRIIKLDNP